MKNKIRILIADDQNIIRWGLSSVLAGQENIEVVGEAIDGGEALEKARLLQPDVILMDLLMPRIDGLAAIQAIIKEIPDARILVLTSYEDERNILAAIKAGAMGFLSKDFDFDNLMSTIEGVYRGNLSIPQKAVRKWVQSLAEPDPEFQNDILTESELRILGLVCQGLSNQEIANTLSVSKSTVRTHVSSLLRKLGVSSRAKAILYAFENGLVQMQKPVNLSDRNPMKSNKPD
jgi:two-component system, NarL family, response regulator LiaR